MTPPPLPCPAYAPDPAHGGPQGTKSTAPAWPATNAMTFLSALKGTYPDSEKREASGPLEGRGFEEKSLWFAARWAGTLTLSGDSSKAAVANRPLPQWSSASNCKSAK